VSWKRFVVGFDVHGDKQDLKANEAFFKFCKHWKPDIRVAGGDIWDFRPLRKKASEEERREGMAVDYRAGVDWFARFKPTHYLRGNHCERLFDLALEDRGIISEYAIQGVNEIEELCKRLRCSMYPYHKREGIVRIGNLKVIHGFLSGVTAARRTALAYGSVLMGHGHGIQHVSIEGIDNRVGRMCGCLCQLDMDYNRANVSSLVHRHGWPYGVVHDSGKYQIWQAEDVGGRWMLPTGIEEL